MNDQTQLEEKKPIKTHYLRNIGILFSCFGVLVLLCAFGYVYYQFIQINTVLNDAIVNTQTTVSHQADELGALQKSTDSLQQDMQKTQTVLAQQTQQQSADQWHLMEAKYLVQLANDNLQFSHNQSLALPLLTRANQILENLQDPNVLEIRKSISADITQLQTTPDVNIKDLYLRLTGLDSQLNQLPFASQVLKPETNQSMETTASSSSWWKKNWEQAVQALSKIVIVRRTDTKALPLLLPEEKSFLYQNLHAQMQTAMWAVLNRNNGVYAASLERAETWIKQYFDQDADKTKAILQELDALRKINIEPPSINLTTTLQLFDKARQ